MFSIGKFSIWFYPFLIIVISFLYLFPITHSGLYVSHDGIPQIARAAASIKAMTDGQFPPRWAKNLNYGYGTPGLIFFYSLNGYAVGFLYLLGINLQDSFKLLMAASFVLAPLFFYLWTSQIFEKKIAFLSSVFYGLAPYSFLDAFVRGQLAESLAFVFVPLVFYSIEKNSKKISAYNILIGGISYALLILSHNILSFVFSFIILGYIIIKSKADKKLLIGNLIILFMGLIVTAYFWIPALTEAKYINSKLFVEGFYKNNFLNFSKIIYSSWGFGSNINWPGGLSAQIGPLHFFFSFACLFLLFKKKIKDRSYIGYWLFVLIIMIFMSIDLSEFLWKKFHILQQFQFPWRFSAFSSFVTPILVGYFFSFKKNSFIFFISLFILLFSSLSMAKVAGYQNRPDEYYFNYPGTAAYHNESTTIWVAGDAYEYPKNPIEVVSGRGKIYNLTRKTNQHSFKLDAETNLTILDNTVYFPGWRVKIDKENAPIEFQDINHRGLITFNVPMGVHFIDVEFGESRVGLIADIISLTGIGFFILIFVLRRKLSLLI
ncbi:hypothetical protein A3F29_00380 [Candidatus Roizmanbacteria bacterium RIFCSPHIGHO2_12_FULL_33_9]|uniref:Membrane protein 6-pyruvoyl-tetrahydropterin synthase-related domain-containing protein n=1 Tax=Candidatus Roizmanbacteria bacterium RIFCSPHIGHO2_12_FULL_33_9 TaxID=1802045 RepID=A0A1F7HGS8_9BACT|nr:MAG: hypothetical protein A3F29_00380 [Candidatus Roizmanbacteria bacterium RIFCSPHIGHO2_12_FULL_33_9]